MTARLTVPTAPIASNHPLPAMHDPTYPPQLGTAGAGGVVDAPPSYENAQGDEIAPVEDVARHYSGETEPPPFDEVGSADARRESRETSQFEELSWIHDAMNT
jgi:hypothetical protein